MLKEAYQHEQSSGCTFSLSFFTTWTLVCTWTERRFPELAGSNPEGMRTLISMLQSEGTVKVMRDKSSEVADLKEQVCARTCTAHCASSHCVSLVRDLAPSHTPTCTHTRTRTRTRTHDGNARRIQPVGSFTIRKRAAATKTSAIDTTG
jgi:hypothetical protein